MKLTVYGLNIRKVLLTLTLEEAETIIKALRSYRKRDTRAEEVLRTIELQLLNQGVRVK